jgi:exopolysaccharide biosynthesis polyprenyl glycosylphosphotransferase
MFNQAHHQRRLVRQIVDAALFCLALGLAYLARAAATGLVLPELEDFRTYLWLAPFVAVLGPAVLASQGFYDRRRLTPRLGVVLVVLRSCAFIVLGLIVVLFLARVQFARSVVIMIGGIGGLFVYARHEFSGWNPAEAVRRRVLWLGSADENLAVQTALSGLERDAVESVGECDPHTTSVAEFVARLHRDAVNIVVVSFAGYDRDKLAPLLVAAEREGVELVLRPGLFHLSPYRLALDSFAGEPVLIFRAQAASPAALAIKQTLDYLLASLLLIPAAPMLGLIALGVKLTSSGPVLFRQARAGLNGRRFDILKIRTMHTDAPSRQAELQPLNQLNGPAFKVADDPRLTPLGRILRRHSLDELPQLWNVLRGEMSLVGPRPLPLEEISRIADTAQRRRLSVKPGLTGLWQVSGRNNLADFADWVRLDLAYIDQWSLWLDCKILLATVPVALLGRGSG